MREKISRRSLLFGLAASAIPAHATTNFPFQAGAPGHFQQSAARPLNTQIANKVADRFALLDPGAVQLRGFLGERCAKNESARLLRKNEDELLSGFQHRPGQQAWVGEHAGKWLHAATLAWAYTKSEALRAKLDRVVERLIATQQADGYLGAYADGAHWGMGEEQKWDVWVHKYNLIGLITCHTYTGDKNALQAAGKIGDLLIKTFGKGASLDLNERSTHVGMASGSVLEPMVLLHRATGEEKYLDFARYIAEHWEEEKGPKLISALTEKKSVKQTANAKAYEMLSCLVGLCELYRSTGESRYFVPAVNAWNDIVANQLLITGSGSSKEHWTAPRQFLSEAKFNIAETCVTLTWIQLNQQLLRLTGDARYADELEKSFYNHLAAAQHPDGSAWAYFTALDGRKPYKTEQNCCTSSGPRGWAMLPSFAYQTSEDGIVINFFTSGSAVFKINGETVTVKQETGYPLDGRVAITVTVPKPMKFGLRVRVPAWSSIEGVKTKPGSYWLLRQTWSRSQTITLDFNVPFRVLQGEGSVSGRAAIARGPIVLALDERFNPDLSSLSSVAINAQSPQLKTNAEMRDSDGVPLFETEAVLTQDTEHHQAGARVTIKLTPFAGAGASGSQYQVWLRRAGT